MAQKRMFDKAIIDTDKFMDLSMSSKALYFLLGMEADDEGFVSYKKVMRIHGGNEDDIKILQVKEFIIGFASGVVVITDWNKNNYLDKNRIRETEYQKEKSQLLLTESGQYELNIGSTSIEESSIEQSRIGESKITPSKIAIDFFTKGHYFDEYLNLFSTTQNRSTIQHEFDKFILYWTELNKSGTKERWQLEKTFEVKKRIHTWLTRNSTYSKKETKIL